MNPLKKLKLKSQLRNCDYILAGTVIKQQYYDAKKPTVINRLIDEFIADPGFDTALKLIEYNDMMVFYFTESCAGGLYVRKTAALEHNKSATEQSPEEEAIEEQDLPEEPHELLTDKPDQHVEEHKKILEESEAWMEQMIASGSRKQQHQPKVQTILETIEETHEHTLVFHIVEEAEPEAAVSSESDDASEEAAFEIPEVESLPPRSAIKQRNYSNVIATLKIDIHTMSRQLDEYRRELSYYPSNEKQLIAWIKALEAAIEEFSDVVDLLEDGV